MSEQTSYIYPKNYMISSGTGISKHKLVAFDAALIDAGISNYNLLRVSSILPISCTKKENLDLKPGSPLLTAYGSISSNKMGECIASAVAVGVPKDSNNIGVIMEYSGISSAAYAEQQVREMVIEAMENHSIEIQEILVSSAEQTVNGNYYVSVISAVTLW